MHQTLTNFSCIYSFTFIYIGIYFQLYRRGNGDRKLQKKINSPTEFLLETSLDILQIRGVYTLFSAVNYILL